jgi:phospholipid transport system substrate-binding protein
MQHKAKVMVVFLLVYTTSAFSAEIVPISPYVVLKSIGTKLFSRIAANQQEIKKFPTLMKVIVEEELMPSIDYRYASYVILGKNLSNTTKKHRAKFVTSMRKYLAKTYSVALMRYKNQQVIFEHEKSVKGKKIVAIKTQIVDSNRPTIDVIFKMRKNKKTGEWKAFDMIIEGISLLSSMKAELSKKIAKLGVEQVAMELASIAK